MSDLDRYTSVGPHAFMPRRRTFLEWLFRFEQECRHCYCSPRAHPIQRYVLARPLGWNGR